MHSPGLSITFLAAICVVLFLQPAMAGNQTWTGGNATSGNWNTVGNWSGGAAPGSTSGTTSTDVATFNAAIANTWGNSTLNPIVIDSATQNIGGITFTDAAVAYFIGSTGGNGLTLSSGGTIQISALSNQWITETINAPLTLAGSYTFADNDNGHSGTNLLYIRGQLNTGVAGSQSLTLTGTNVGPPDASFWRASMIAGTITGSGAITKTGTGTWCLGEGGSGDTNNQNYQYSGDINVNAGILAFQANHNGKFLSKSKLTINGGTVGMTGSAGIFSIFGTSGTLYGYSGTSKYLSINYTGIDASAGFTGTIGGGTGSNAGYGLWISGAGSGNLNFGTFTGYGSNLQNVGTGTITAVAINNTTSVPADK